MPFLSNQTPAAVSNTVKARKRKLKHGIKGGNGKKKKTETRNIQ